MRLWLNIGFGWISILLAVLLSVIYLLRIAVKSGKAGRLASSVNQGLRKYHKQLGILLILTGLIHGHFSSQEVWSFNAGTIAWIVSILLGANWMFRKRLSGIKGWLFYHRILTLLFIATVAWHIVDVGEIQLFRLLEGNARVSGVSAKADPLLITGPQGFKLKDGVFEGEATGFNPGLKVSVEIKDSKIAGITVLEHNEVNSRYYAKPIEIIPANIIKAQSTEVDTVSGATFTSVGIINAVNDALSKALISGELPADRALPEKRGHGRRR